jgi:hypothetical protein
VFGRRRPIEKWPAGEIVEHIAYCAATDPERIDVRGAIVLHREPALLPKRQANDPEFSPYLAFGLHFEEEDRFGLYMADDNTVVVKERTGHKTLPEARAWADVWVGETKRELPFHYMPGLYQSAFIEAICGYRNHDGDMLIGSWILPTRVDDGQLDASPTMLMAREFPPKVDAVNESEDVGRGWTLFETKTVDELIRQRGF